MSFVFSDVFFLDAFSKFVGEEFEEMFVDGCLRRNSWIGGLRRNLWVGS